MTRAELEQIARQVRVKGLHSSWNELIEFSDCIVVSLVDAYQALLRNSVGSDGTPSTSTSDLHKMVQGKLAKALASLTSEAQVARWESEARAGTGNLSGGVPRLRW